MFQNRHFLKRTLIALFCVLSSGLAAMQSKPTKPSLCSDEQFLFLQGYNSPWFIKPPVKVSPQSLINPQEYLKGHVPHFSRQPVYSSTEEWASAWIESVCMLKKYIELIYFPNTTATQIQEKWPCAIDAHKFAASFWHKATIEQRKHIGIIVATAAAFLRSYGFDSDVFKATVLRNIVRDRKSSHLPSVKIIQTIIGKQPLALDSNQQCKLWAAVCDKAKHDRDFAAYNFLLFYGGIDFNNNELQKNLYNTLEERFSAININNLRAFFLMILTHIKQPYSTEFWNAFKDVIKDSNSAYLAALYLYLKGEHHSSPQLFLPFTCKLERKTCNQIFLTAIERISLNPRHSLRIAQQMIDQGSTDPNTFFCKVVSHNHQHHKTFPMTVKQCFECYKKFLHPETEEERKYSFHGTTQDILCANTWATFFVFCRKYGILQEPITEDMWTYFPPQSLLNWNREQLQEKIFEATYTGYQQDTLFCFTQP